MASGFPGAFQGGFTTGYLNIGAVQKVESGIKKVSGMILSNVKKISSVAIASVKKISSVSA